MLKAVCRLIQEKKPFLSSGQKCVLFKGRSGANQIQGGDIRRAVPAILFLIFFDRHAFSIMVRWLISET